MLGGSTFSSHVKEKVQALLNQLSILPGYSSMRKPGFVYLLEGDPEGIIFARTTLLKLRISDFQQAILQPIWRSFGRSTRRKPEAALYRALGFYLDNQLNSKFHETLGHENKLDIVSNQGPKI